MNHTWRDIALYAEHHLDITKGVRPGLPDFNAGSETCSGVDEERLRVEEDAAAVPLGPSLVRRKVVMAVK